MDLPHSSDQVYGGVFGLLRPALALSLSKSGVVVLPEGKDLRSFLQDAEVLGLGVEIFPRRLNPDLHSAERFQQMRALSRLQNQVEGWVVCLTESLNEKVEIPGEDVTWLGDNQGPARDLLEGTVEELKLKPVERVESAGQVSIRGGLVDAWFPGQEEPWRFDYFGDELESLHAFDPVSQRRTQSLHKVTWSRTSSKEMLWTQLIPSGCPVVWMDCGQKTGTAPQANHWKTSTFDEGVRLPSLSTDSLEGDFHQRLEKIRAYSQEGPVHLFFETEVASEKFKKDLGDETVRGLTFHVGRVSQGVRYQKTTFINAHLLFGKTPVRRQPSQMLAYEKTLLADLKMGDLVVHVEHGIARYKGSRMITREGVSNEFMNLEFADRVNLYVPATQMDLVQRYVGSGPAKPSLSKLGGQRWAGQKQKVAEAVDDLAEELLHLQARRRDSEGISFPAMESLQKEFAMAFPHEETADQIQVLEDIEKDMTATFPMDRLLCGDVGFGKTEVALRAAYKAICASKQVCVVVPTTVLAEQHRRTFTERFRDFPVSVACLSRFTPPKEAKKILASAESGSLDVLIGTHRVLGEKVQLLDPGLIIIDEEQRFGVRHKELVKRWRVGVDILTLSATPIPRTLHMALLGLRDISNITTPPFDRQAVATRVMRPDDNALKQALQRELERGGQAFILHNRVKSLEARAERIRELVPQARVIYAHGQMEGHELEEAMLAMVRHEVDILVCTTIIESGVDIPNVNTIVVDDAHRFGLADLHQLRGRVGRADRRGFAILFLPAHGSLNDRAKRRLQAMEEYADLGAGFQIAMRDLEIRGAGNILGAEQSGHIMTVGYELYCQLLEDAVNRRRGDTESVHREPVSVDLPLAAYLPESFTGSRRVKVTLLRRLLAVTTITAMDELEEEIRDRFGRMPEALANLLVVLRIKILLSKMGVRALAQSGKDLLLKGPQLFGVDQALKRFPGKFFLEADQSVRLIFSIETKNTLDRAQILLESIKLPDGP